MEMKRPDPDQLVRSLQTATTKDGRGRLKIFFGYAAGVGKTYAMLDAAQSVKKSGVDVVLGYIEPHSRPETMAMTKEFEAIPPKEVRYKDILLREFDLDAALARKPQLVLVDELAHTNALGCRHRKRYDDVEELLAAGIDVYTTINVQHLESLNDIVAGITQVVVKERIPDSVFDQADQVELIDIEPDDLMQRLNQGKIYREGQAKKALEHFFVRENLVALREIALRRTADRVNRLAEQTKMVSGGQFYYTGEHILTCISGSPSNPKVLRTAARMANAFRGRFTALYVETPQTQNLGGKNQERLKANLKLAEQLGAKIATVYGEDIPYQIAEYAKASGISKIVLGRSRNKQWFFNRKQNFVDRLTALAPQIDIHIIPDYTPAYQKLQKRNFLQLLSKSQFTLGDWALTAGVLALCVLLGFVFLQLQFSEANVITIFILGVLVISALTGSRVYGLLGSVGGVLLFNFFFTHPQFTFRAYDSSYPITFGVMLLASLITSSLTMRVREQAVHAARKAHRTEALLETSQKLQRAETLEEIIFVSANQMISLLDKTVLFYPAGAEGLQKPRIFLNQQEREAGRIEKEWALYAAPDEQAVAAWVYKNKRAAGISTDTLPGAKALYLPVKSNNRVFAVVAVALQPQEEIEPFERSLLSAILNEVASAIEKYQLNENQKNLAMETEKERLRANLLRAISHDLRTPLTGISGNASILLEQEQHLQPAAKQEIYESIYDDSLWLINLVENLLSVTRLDNGSMALNLQPELLDDVIQEALRHINRKKSLHTIGVHLEDDLLMAKMDARLIVQVIINIVDNAIKYTREGSRIEISAKRRQNQVLVEIADDGDGISDQDKEKLFDMYFTANQNKGDSRRGLGLGLSLCKSIINAHGGEISVGDNQPKGTVMAFTLQAEEAM